MARCRHADDINEDDNRNVNSVYPEDTGVDGIDTEHTSDEQSQRDKSPNTPREEHVNDAGSDDRQENQAHDRRNSRTREAKNRPRRVDANEEQGDAGAANGRPEPRMKQRQVKDMTAARQGSREMTKISTQRNAATNRFTPPYNFRRRLGR